MPRLALNDNAIFVHLDKISKQARFFKVSLLTIRADL